MVVLRSPETRISVCILLSLASFAVSAQRPTVNRLLLITTTSNANSEAFKRFNRSVQAYHLDLSVIASQPNARSDRIEVLKKALTTYKNEPTLVVMVVDSQNSVINANAQDILARFDKFKPETRIVFSADPKCWPDSSLESKYPSLDGTAGNRFLNGRAFIGFAPKLWDLLTWNIKDQDEQLFFTKAYLDPDARSQLAIEIDHKAELFQNLDSLEGDVRLEFHSDSVSLKNSIYQSEPVVVHGGGASRVSTTCD